MKKKYDVSIRAFVKGNLGDDIFIHILTNRYPNASFAICGEKEYEHLLSEHRNLTYVCTDTFWRKNFFRAINLPAHIYNRVRRLFHKNTRWPYYRCAQHLNTRSKYPVLISGSIFMQIYPKFAITDYYASEQKYFKMHPVVIGCNFGPYLEQEYYDFYADCFSKARNVCFRDSYSYSLFHGENFDWAPDILFLYPKEQCIMPRQKDYIFISVVNLAKDGDKGVALEENYESALAGFIEKQLNAGEKIVLAGFCKSQNDHKVIEKILEKVPTTENIMVLNYPNISYQEMIGYIASAKSVVATRYHAMILGWVYGKKVLPISYSEKMLHVIEDINADMEYLQIDDLTEEKISKAYKRTLAQEPVNVVELIEKAAKQFSELDRLL